MHRYHLENNESNVYRTMSLFTDFSQKCSPFFFFTRTTDAVSKTRLCLCFHWQNNRLRFGFSIVQVIQQYLQAVKPFVRITPSLLPSLPPSLPPLLSPPCFLAEVSQGPRSVGHHISLTGTSDSLMSSAPAG